MSTGRLLVVATPIGNMADLSSRAREALATATLVVAEDTRHTLRLLSALGITRPLLSLHAHNEPQRVPEVLARLEEGAQVALVSDAGTPLLSDPGCELVRRAAEAGFMVTAIPGPSAITTALAVAGLPASRFCFEGFLPPRERDRRAALAALAAQPRTLVFFEGPHRISEMLADLAAELGSDRHAVVTRELTKLHETIYRGSLGDLAQAAAADDNFRRGELTVVVQGAVAAAQDPGDTLALRRAVELLIKELPPGRAAAVAAQLTGAKRSAAYALVTRLTGNTPAKDDPGP